VQFTVDRRLCIRCGVSATLAPGLIRVEHDEGAVLIRQPTSEAETAALQSASLVCPVGAIRVVAETADLRGTQS